MHVFISTRQNIFNYTRRRTCPHVKLSRNIGFGFGVCVDTCKHVHRLSHLVLHHFGKAEVTDAHLAIMEEDVARLQVKVYHLVFLLVQVLEPGKHLWLPRL